MKSILYQQNQIATACQISFPIHKNAIGACFKPLSKTRQKYTHCQIFNFERSFQLWLDNNHKCFKPFPTKHGLNSNHLGEKTHHLIRVKTRTSTAWLMDLLTSWPVVYPHYVRTDSVSTSMAGDWKKHKIRSINRNRNTYIFATVKNFGENIYVNIMFLDVLAPPPWGKKVIVTFLFGCLTNTTPPSESP